MLRIGKVLGWLGVLFLASPLGHASSWLGPKEGYQTDLLGYDSVRGIPYPGNIWLIETGGEWTFAPKNLGDEYRWSVPLIFYAYESPFLDYFGSNGVFAVDSAVGILNALPRVSEMSEDLSEFPLEELHFNFTAQAMHLFDLKSAALEMLVQQLGLADPERWTWCIRQRIPLPPPLTCPFIDQVVIQRNFDPVTLTPSKFVNGNLFTYQILQWCTPEFPSDRTDAIEFLIDPLDTYQTAVASEKIIFPNLSYYGAFHTGLTRDDVGTIRYLYRTNNMNVEISSPDSLLFQTNPNPQLVVSSNLTLLAAQALTNNAAALIALYPGLVITGTTNSFVAVAVTNLTPFFTNEPWVPAGFFRLAFATNVTFTVQNQFIHTFGNVLTLQFINGQWVTMQVNDLAPMTNRTFVTIQTSVVTNAPWSPVGSPLLITNSISRTFLSNQVSGEFFILPTNICDLTILSVLLTNVTAITNSLVATNNLGLTNVNGQFFSQDIIGFATNHAFAVQFVECTSTNIALRQGLDKISFVRHDFDSLLGRFWSPVTNDYVMIAVTNSTPVRQRFRRVVTRPDILFTVGDFDGTTDPMVETVNRFISQPFFNTTVAVTNNGNIGPGTIEGPVQLVFNKTGPTKLNTTPFWGDEAIALFHYQWASFDASTNAPFLYPTNSSIYALEQQVLIQISPSFLISAVSGTNYTVTLSVTGGRSPFVWSVPAGSVLPPGLMLTQNALNSAEATLAGEPAVPGTFNFTVRLTDASGNAIDTVYSLVVNPPP